MPSLHWKENKKKTKVIETQGNAKGLISIKGPLILTVTNRTLKSGGSNTRSHTATAVPTSHDLIHTECLPFSLDLLLPLLQA